MIKGWRNNPEWVKYREDQKEALVKRRIQIKQAEAAIIQAMRGIKETEDDIKKFDKLLNRPRFSLFNHGD